MKFVAIPQRRRDLAGREGVMGRTSRRYSALPIAM
jgi:hypothetical protein